MDKLRVGNTEIGTFDFIIRSLIVILPFTTILSVFTSQIIGIRGFTYIKEMLLIGAFSFLVFKYIRKELIIRWGWIDGIIGMYILYMCGISILTTGIGGIIYGGRYDFEFIIMFFVIYHGAELLSKPNSYYLRLFIISTGIMLFLSGILKFPLSEDILLYFGYSGNPSSWEFGNVPPIFHGIEGANIRRFQGILDGPNTMGAFLIMISGIFSYFMKNRKEWYFVTGLILASLFIMVLYTYSRSALLGLICGYMLIFIGSIHTIVRKYRTQFFSIIISVGLIGGIILIQYSGTLQAIINRSGSTKGHFERMSTSIERFMDFPMGQGLGSSGPAYRYVQKLEGKDRADMTTLDAFYIPESWYIQQFVEGGVIGGLLFLVFVGMIVWKLFWKHAILGGMFLGILIMNLFLHTFESAPFSLLLFLLLGLLLSKRTHGHHVYERESL